MNNPSTSTGPTYEPSGQQNIRDLLSLLRCQSQQSTLGLKQKETNLVAPPSAQLPPAIIQAPTPAPLSQQQIAEAAGLLLQYLKGNVDGDQSNAQAHPAAAASNGRQPQAEAQEAARQRINAQLLTLLAVNNEMNLSSQQGQQSQNHGSSAAPVQGNSDATVLSNYQPVGLPSLAQPQQTVQHLAPQSSGFNELVASLGQALGVSMGTQPPQHQGQPGGGSQSLGPGPSTLALPDLQMLLAIQGSNQQVGSKSTPALPNLQNLLAIQGSKMDCTTKTSSSVNQASSTVGGGASAGCSYEAGSISGRNILARKGYPMRDIVCPGPHDVLMGRGSGTSSHIGNVKYRDLVLAYKPRYVAADRVNKPSVAGEVVALWRSMEPPGRFLDRSDSADDSSNMWFDVGDRRARRKTSQTLREKLRPKQEHTQKLSG